MQLMMHWVKQELQPTDPPPGFHLRTYKEGDASGWIETCADGLGTANWSEQDFQKNMLAADGIKPQGIFLVVTDDGRIVGTATGRLKPEPGLGYLHMVAVKPAFRGLRLSHLLNMAALNYLVRAGCTRVVLHTDDYRLPAIKGYLSLGFRPIIPDDRARFRWQIVLKTSGRKSTETVMPDGRPGTILASYPLLPLQMAPSVWLIEPFHGAFLVARGGKGLLVDASVAEKSREITDGLEAAGLSGVVQAILCTHCHLDHSGGCGNLSRAFNAPVYAHANDASCIEDTDLFFSKHPWGRETYGAWAGAHCRVLSLSIGDAVGFGGISIEPIHTPGHTPGSICYALPDEGVIFTGDLLQYSRYYQGHRWMGIIEDAAALRLSWLELLRRQWKVMLPGHGGFDVDWQPINSGDHAARDLSESVKYMDNLTLDLKSGFRSDATPAQIREYLTRAKDLHAVNGDVEMITASALRSAALNMK